MFFYAWWRVDFLALLLGSTIVNFAIGTAITNRHCEGRTTRPLLIAGLTFNLALIAGFKYAGLLAASANDLFAFGIPIPHLFLPLAISFFTFEQISYLVDAAAGRAPRYSFLNYALFVSFFPHLIAGPIIRHNDLIPQFDTSRDNNKRSDDIAVGMTLFTIGLAKKTLIADNLAPFSDAVFSAAHHGAAIGAADAWMGTLFFAFQIYFDFSGYSDMALGSACLFGIRLPMNFNSPYKAASIIEFWRLWHISLSTFLRDYLYIPLGGNRHGSVRRYINLFLTMLLGGLWHGANWTFVIWGGLHGFYLIVNHAWRRVDGQIQHRGTARSAACHTCTFRIHHLPGRCFCVDCFPRRKLCQRIAHDRGACWRRRRQPLPLPLAHLPPARLPRCLRSSGLRPTAWKSPGGSSQRLKRAIAMRAFARHAGNGSRILQPQLCLVSSSWSA